MAYTGILTRGDTFDTIYLDPPIAREVTMAGEMLGAAGMSSTVYWLNLASLAEIGKVVDDIGTTVPGFKTSNLPITFDGTGYFREAAEWVLVDSTYKFRYEPLNALEVLSDTSFKFASKNINVGVLDFISTTPVTLSALTTTGVTVNFTAGVKVIIYNETTGAVLTSTTTDGEAVTFSGQTIGDVISGQAIDTDFNHSAKHSLTIA